MKYLFYPIAILFLALTCTEFFPVLMRADILQYTNGYFMAWGHILLLEDSTSSLVTNNGCKQLLTKLRMRLLE